jgi:hypothetical protein
MNTEQILSKLRDASKNCPVSENGFIPVSKLGHELVKIGFDYHELGYKKLGNMLRELNGHLEISTTIFPSGLPYVKFKNGSNSEPVIVDISEVKPVEAPKRVWVENLELGDWGIIFDCNTKLKKLKEISLHEPWYYGMHDEGTYPILKNYLLYTFKRLAFEGKIVSTAEFAAFDTGLVNSRYDSIYAIFAKNDKFKIDPARYHEWVLVAFAPASDRYWGVTLDNNFNPHPPRANYFKGSEEMYYDTNQREPNLSDNHIIIDNIERFPVEFLEPHLGQHFQIARIFSLPYFERMLELEKIKAFLKDKAGDKTVVNMRNRLKDSIEAAVKRIQWNFKTAIPMYFPRANKMSLLIPLSLIDDNIVDVALVVARMKAGGYRGMTILTLEQAYKSARLVSRPDSDWLIANTIQAKEEDDADLESLAV